MPGIGLSNRKTHTFSLAKGILNKKQNIIQAAARLWRIKPRNPEIRGNPAINNMRIKESYHVTY
ncbi:hypothetical protein ES703_81952 [subsurface metagenome]